MHKVIFLQLRSRVAKPIENAKRILEFIGSEAHQGKIFITPELFLWGYPPRDSLAYFNAAVECDEAIKLLCEGLKNFKGALLVGHPQKNQNSGKPFYNAASLFLGARLAQTFKKRRLPNYDVFDDSRFFEVAPEGQSSVFEFEGKRYLVSICEDMWDSVLRFGFKDVFNYSKESSPLFGLKSGDFDAILNLSASPFALDKAAKREDLFMAHAQRWGCPLYYCNAVGGQDDVLFDGGSFRIDPRAQLIYRAPRFIEGAFDGGELSVAAPESEFDVFISALCMGIKDFIYASGFENVILGISGGIDSALCAYLAVRALGKENVLCYFLPSALSSSTSRRLATEVCQSLGVRLQEFSIAECVDGVSNELGLGDGGLPYENLQSRLRGLYLMALSNKLGALVLSTGNKSELAMGYSTLYGDSCGALMPIGDLYKSEVYGLCNFINTEALLRAQPAVFPLELIFREPTAELASGQKDSDSLPSYEKLDAFLLQVIEAQADFEKHLKEWNVFLEPFTVQGLLKKIENSEFKRYQAAPILRVHSRAFGSGRRMPLATGPVK